MNDATQFAVIRVMGEYPTQDAANEVLCCFCQEQRQIIALDNGLWRAGVVISVHLAMDTAVRRLYEQCMGRGDGLYVAEPL